MVAKKNSPKSSLKKLAFRTHSLLKKALFFVMDIPLIWYTQHTTLVMLLSTPLVHTHLLWCSLSHLVFLSPHRMPHHFTSLVFPPPLSIIYEPHFSMNIVSRHYLLLWIPFTSLLTSWKILFWHLYHAPSLSSSSTVVRNWWHLICHDALLHPKCVCSQQCHHNIVHPHYWVPTSHNWTLFLYSHVFHVLCGWALLNL